MIPNRMISSSFMTTTLDFNSYGKSTCAEPLGHDSERATARPSYSVEIPQGCDSCAGKIPSEAVTAESNLLAMLLPESAILADSDPREGSPHTRRVSKNGGRKALGAQKLALPDDRRRPIDP